MKSDYIVSVVLLSAALVSFGISFFFYTPLRSFVRKMRISSCTYSINIFSFLLYSAVILFAFTDICLALDRKNNDTERGTTFVLVWTIIYYFELIYSFGPSLIAQATEIAAVFDCKYRFFGAALRELKFYGLWLIILVLALIFVIILNKAVNWLNVDFLLIVAQLVLNSFLIHYYLLILSYGMFRSLLDLLKIISGKACNIIVGFTNKQIFSVLSRLLGEIQSKHSYFRVLKARLLELQDKENLYKMAACGLVSLQLVSEICETKIYPADTSIIEVQSSFENFFNKEQISIQTAGAMPSLVMCDQSNNGKARKLLNKFALRIENKTKLQIPIEDQLYQLKLACYRYYREYQLLMRLNQPKQHKVVVRMLAGFGFLISACLIVILIMAQLYLFAPEKLLSVNLFRQFMEWSGSAYAVFLTYLILFGYTFYGLSVSRIGSFYKLSVFSTDPNCVFFFCNRLGTVARLCSWNMTRLLNLTEDTAYFQVMGRMKKIPFIGIDIMDYAPGIVGFLFLVYLIVNVFQIKNAVDGNLMFGKLQRQIGSNLGRMQKEAGLITDLRSIVERFQEPSFLDKIFKIVYDGVWERLRCGCSSKISRLMDEIC